MKLSDSSKKILIDELGYVSHRLKKESGIPKLLFVYSAAYGVAFRMLNIEFDPELVLIHNVLLHSYTEINSRFGAMASGAEKVITIPESLFSFIGQSLQDLADMISKGGDIIVPLGKIAIAAYATTGNGYYLYEKGVLRL